MKPFIAYVDDNLDNLKNIKMNLDEHFQVKTFISPASLLDTIDHHLFDCFLLDVRMPAMDGFELLEQLQNHPHTFNSPVIMVTSYPEEENRIKALQNGAVDYVDRLIKHDELIARLKAKISFRKKNSAAILRVGNLTLNMQSLTIKINEKELQLSVNEIKILYKLCSCFPEHVSKNDLVKFVWGNRLTVDNNLNTQLYIIRNKMDGWDHIINNSKICGLSVQPK